MTEVVLAPLPPRRRTRTSPGPCVEVAQRRRHADPAGRRRARRARHGGAAARRGGARSGRSSTLRLIFRPEWTGDRERRRRRAGARPERRPGLPRERGVHVQPARAAPSADRRRPARRRPGRDGRRRRSPGGLQRRDDELRARADARPARRGHRLGLRRRRLLDARVRRHAAQPAVRPRRRAAGLDLAPAHVLRRLRARAGCRDLAERRRRRRDAARAHLQGRAPLDRDRDADRARRRGRLHRDAARSSPGTYPVAFPPAPLDPDRARARRAGRGPVAARRSTRPTTSAGSRRRAQEFSVNTTLGFAAALAPHARRARARQADDRGRRVADAPGARDSRRSRRRRASQVAPIAVRDAAGRPASRVALERDDARRRVSSTAASTSSASAPRTSSARSSSSTPAVPRHPRGAGAEEEAEAAPRLTSAGVPVASILSEITDLLTTVVGDYGLYAVFLLMLVDAVLPGGERAGDGVRRRGRFGRVRRPGDRALRHDARAGLRGVPRGRARGHDRLHCSARSAAGGSASTAAGRSSSATGAGCT